jgi:hypothetical protein
MTAFASWLSCSIGTISVRMPPVASLGFGERLVNKCAHWSPKAIAMSALRVISWALDS